MPDLVGCHAICLRYLSSYGIATLLDSKTVNGAKGLGSAQLAAAKIRHDRRRLLLVDKNAVPQLQYDQRKYFGGVTLRLCIAFDQILDSFLSEIAARK